MKRQRVELLCYIRIIYKLKSHVTRNVSLWISVTFRPRWQSLPRRYLSFRLKPIQVSMSTPSCFFSRFFQGILFHPGVSVFWSRSGRVSIPQHRKYIYSGIVSNMPSRLSDALPDFTIYVMVYHIPIVVVVVVCSVVVVWWYGTLLWDQ